MTPAQAELPFDLAPVTAPPRVERNEPRTRSVRLVECAPFPRTRAHQSTRLGLTRDVSDTGLRLQLEGGLPASPLVRVRVRGLSGRPEVDAVARVVWSRASGHSSTELGLALLPDTRRMRRARRASNPRVQLAYSA